MYINSKALHDKCKHIFRTKGEHFNLRFYHLMPVEYDIYNFMGSSKKLFYQKRAFMSLFYNSWYKNDIFMSYIKMTNAKNKAIKFSKIFHIFG